MQKKTVFLLVAVWALVLSGITAATVILLSDDGASTQWISTEDSDMLERYARLENIRRTISESFYREVDDDALMQGAIDGMLAALQDPYTMYLSPEEMAQLDAETEGEYHGLGLVVHANADGMLEVLRVYSGSPAEAAGVQAEDCIIAIDHIPVNGKDTQRFSEAMNLLTGEDGSSVHLSLQRGIESLECTAIWGSVHIVNVTACMLEDAIGYIQITEFSGNAAKEFEAAIQYLNDANAKGVIVDLRNNPGGLLDQVAHMADCILPEGCIVYTQNRAGGREDLYSDNSCWDLPMVILMNKNSASASEIFAAAAQDYGRALVVGTQSYGKGIVQNLIEFEPDGAGLQFTESTYFTPNGRNIHGTGVTPDILSEDASGYKPGAQVPDAETDLQLRDALSALHAQLGGA